MLDNIKMKIGVRKWIELN